MPSNDVAIIGGGPAGLATAIEFASLGFLVTVIEPKDPIIDKPCGEGLMPEGVAHLQRLKVLQHLDKEHMSLVRGICFINEDKKRAFSNFVNGLGLGCRRLNLSKALYARTRELANIRLWQAKALAVHKSDQAMIVSTDQGTLDARLIVGADGLRSQVRRWADLEGGPARLKRYGLRQHFKIKPWSEHVLVYFRPGIEAYVTPCGPEQTNVAFLWTKGKLITSKISFNNLLTLFPDVKSHLGPATPLSKESAIGPLEQKCTAPIAHGLALVGDASGYLDAITGEGNSIALASAHALSAITHKALNKGPKVLSYDELKPYAKAHRSIVRSYYRNTSILLWLSAHPRLMSALISAGASYPQLFSHSIEALRSSGKYQAVKIA